MMASMRRYATNDWSPNRIERGKSIARWNWGVTCDGRRVAEREEGGDGDGDEDGAGFEGEGERSGRIEARSAETGGVAFSSDAARDVAGEEEDEGRGEACWRRIDSAQATSAQDLTAARNRERIARKNRPRHAPNVAPAVVGVHDENHRLDAPSLHEIASRARVSGAERTNDINSSRCRKRNRD